MDAVIVLIDSEADKRFLMEHFLSRAFPEVRILSFADCPSALSAVIAEGPKVVITNGKIAQRDGIEFTAYVRREVGAPVVMVSLRQELATKAYAAGVSAFLESGDNAGLQKAVFAALESVKENGVDADSASNR